MFDETEIIMSLHNVQQYVHYPSFFLYKTDEHYFKILKRALSCEEKAQLIIHCYFWDKATAVVVF